MRLPNVVGERILPTDLPDKAVRRADHIRAESYCGFMLAGR
jgi:hypothetical protein